MIDIQQQEQKVPFILKTVHFTAAMRKCNKIHLLRGTMCKLQGQPAAVLSGPERINVIVMSATCNFTGCISDSTISILSLPLVLLLAWTRFGRVQVYVYTQTYLKSQNKSLNPISDFRNMSCLSHLGRWADILCIKAPC